MNPAEIAAAGARPVSRAAASSLRLSSRDGTELHASVWRAPNPSAGLLLIHGMQSHSGWFEAAATAAEAAAAGITVLSYDRRGSGRSGGERGHVGSEQAFLDDLAAAHDGLVGELVQAGGEAAPVHALANCFGTRILLPFLEQRPGAFRTVVLTAPATAMSRAADYGPGTKLRILFAAAERRFPTPLRDELFVSSGPFLDWIRADALSLREVSAGFLRATRRLTVRMHRAARTLTTPLLVVLGARDAMVENGAIRAGLVGRYRGPVRVIELECEHYVDFTDQQPRLAAALVDWIRSHAAAEERS